MKYLTRYFSLFLCFLLLFAVFSLPVSAKSVKVPSYKVKGYLQTIYSGVPFSQGFEWTPNNGTVEKLSQNYAGSFVYSTNNELKIQCSYFIIPNTSPLLEPEDSITVTLKNVFFEQYLTINGTKYFYQKPDTQRALLYYNNGSMEYVNDIQFEHKGGSLANISLTFKPKDAVKQIEVILGVTPNLTNYNGATIYVGGALGEWQSDNSHDVFIEESSEDTGLLKGIVEWLKGIKNGITDLFNSIADLPSKIWSFLKQGFDSLGNGITNVFNTLVELPSKLWDLISEGLKALFVPDSEYITLYKDKWDTLLSARFGCVYEVGQIVIDFFNRFSSMDLYKDWVYLPIVTISLPEGESFSFGGYEVPVVPQGFSWLVNIIKTCINICCILLFINAMLKRYDKLIGGEN